MCECIRSCICTRSVEFQAVSDPESIIFGSMLALAKQPAMGHSNALLDHKHQQCLNALEGGSGLDMSSSECMPCLPRRTVVLVTGNNRTKKTLIGQQAVVKRAVGLGGWHHCVLQDGSEVKLQRNALSVLEMGPPETIDDSSACSSADTDAREPKIDVLTQPRIRKPSRALFPAQDVPAFRRPALISSSGLYGTPSVVDLHKLEPTSLKRYRHVFQLGQVSAEASKAQLATAVQQHFTTQEVDEEEVLLDLVFALRRRYKRQQLSPVQPHSTPVQHQYNNTLDLSRSLSAHSSQCLFDTLQQHQQQQQLQQQGGEEEEGEEGDFDTDGDNTAAAASAAGEASSDDQLRQLILLQQQYVYLGPKLFQEAPAQQQQQQQAAPATPATAAAAAAPVTLVPAAPAAPAVAASAPTEQQQPEAPAAAVPATQQEEQQPAPAVAAPAVEASAAAAPAVQHQQQQPSPAVAAAPVQQQ